MKTMPISRHQRKILTGSNQTWMKHGCNMTDFLYLLIIETVTWVSETPQIAIICWANAGILSAVLLARRRQMTLARCHFAHRANLIANRWFDVGPTPIAQQALHMPTILSRWAMIYGHHASININSLEIFDFPYTLCYWLEQFIP